MAPLEALVWHPRPARASHGTCATRSPLCRSCMLERCLIAHDHQATRLAMSMTITGLPLLPQTTALALPFFFQSCPRPCSQMPCLLHPVHPAGFRAHKSESLFVEQWPVPPIHGLTSRSRTVGSCLLTSNICLNLRWCHSCATKSHQQHKNQCAKRRCNCALQ